MKIKLNDYTVSLDALKKAAWKDIDSGNDTTYRVADESGHVICAIPIGDEPWWDGIEAQAVPAIDAEGKPCTISISLDVCDDESSHIYINTTEEVSYAEADDEDYYAQQLAELIGREIGGRMRLDYDSAAAEFLADHEGYIYVMANHRGFANEWSLYACKDEAEAAEIERLHSDTTRYAADEVKTWIRDAMQSREDYKADHAADKCCGMMYATDDPDYGVPLSEGEDA